MILKLTKDHLALYKALSSEHPVFKYVHVDQLNIIASDGFILVRRPIEGPSTPVLLPPYDSQEIDLDKADTIAVNNYPNSTVMINKGKKEPSVHITLKYDLLKKLLEALGTDVEYITLAIRDKYNPVYFSTYNNGPDGLIMPYYLSEVKDNG